MTRGASSSSKWQRTASRAISSRSSQASPRVKMAWPRARGVLSAFGRLGDLEDDLQRFHLPSSSRFDPGAGTAPRYSAAALVPPPSISASSLGGDIGSDCGRMPMASPIALPMAASVGTTGTSPTPLSP